MSALWSREALCKATGGRLLAPIEASSVSIDTRSLQPGDLFVALKGNNSDGHAHGAAALLAGAAGVMVDHSGEGERDPRLLEVADTTEGLAALGRFGRARFAGKMIAVTGSVGKTTTKEMLRLALGAFGTTHAAAASHNNHWGVPLTLARLPPDAAFCVCEIGMNHPGEIAPLAAMARPDVAIITNIGSSHIGQMGSLEAIAREKGALLESLGPNGVAIVPQDASALPHVRGRTIRLGSPDACIVELSLAAEASRMVVQIDGRQTAVSLAAPGRHMAENALACLTAVAALDLDLPHAADAVSRFTPSDGRGALRPLLGGAALLLDESYNASTASMLAALDLLRLHPARRRVAILGDMLELGDFAISEHASLAPALLAAADIVYGCGSMMRRPYDLLPESLHGGFASGSAELAPMVAAALRPGDLVLVKGSHGSRMDRVVTALLGGSC